MIRFAVSLSLLLGIASCTTAPPDVLACTELEIDRGFCITTLSGKAGFVDDHNKLYDPVTDKEYSWFEMRPYFISIPAQDYARLKTYIITQCKATKQCDSSAKNWERTLINLDEVLKSKTGVQDSKK